MAYNEFPERGHEVTVFTPEESTGIEDGDGVEVATYETRYVPGIRYTIPGTDFYSTAKELLEWCDACLIVSYCYPPSTMMAVLARSLNTRSVVVVNNLIGIEWSYGNRIVDAVGIAYTHTLGRLTFRCADEVVGQGTYVEEALSRFVADGKLTIIQTGVDTEQYVPEPGPDPIEDGTRLLYVGRLDPVKNVPGLLRAFEALTDDERAYELTIVGDGTQRETHERLAEELGIEDRVTFEGYQPNVKQYYNEHDVLVLTSKAEGPPGVIREAQSCGTPVVATDVGGVRELVRGGVVTDVAPPAIAEGIREIADRDFDELGARARRHMKDRFDLDQTVDEYLELLR